MFEGSMQVYYEKPVVVWEFNKCLLDTEKNKNSLVECFVHGLNLYQKNNENSKILWLNDTSTLQAMGADIQKMLDDFVNENVISYRLSGKMAFVQPQDTIGRVIVKLYVANALNAFFEAGLDFPIEIFDTKFQAIEWLKQPVQVLQAA